MYETSVRTGSGRVDIKRGTEGPRQDPWSYTETTYRCRQVSAMLHDGLAVYCTVTINNGPTKLYEGRLGDDRVVHYAFAAATGYTAEQLHKFIKRAQNRCRACGCGSTHTESGFPGETLNVCDNCGTIIAGSFNRSAVE